MKYYSQYGQDQFLDQVCFGGMVEGTFVDIGAGDGLEINNTYFFECNRRWKGVCIEPQEELFNKLTQNRHCFVENGCISNFRGEEKFLLIKGYSGSLSGLLKKYDPQHLQRIDAETQQYRQTKEIINVKCMLLEDVLKKYNITKIDFCSIDTEGGELDILKSIDFTAISIKIFVVENPYKVKKMRDFMVSRGYALIKTFECDDIYQRKDTRSLNS